MTEIKHIDLTAYDDVENLDRFNENSFINYCNEKLGGCTKHINFINKYIINNQWNGRVLEIGSGNSKLLYRLEKENLITNVGYGYEISKSRFNFAEKLKDYVNSKKVVNYNEDFLSSNLVHKELDLIIAVDIVLQLISPLKRNAESLLLKKIYKMLKKGGYFLIELWDFINILKLINLAENKELKIWEQFPKSDPFEYGLYNITLDKQKNIVWEKTFIERKNKNKSYFCNILKPYSKNIIKELLRINKFKNVNIFNRWSDNEKQVLGEYIVLARK